VKSELLVTPLSRSPIVISQLSRSPISACQLFSFSLAREVFPVLHWAAFALLISAFEA
jgi:hypothetical protein